MKNYNKIWYKKLQEQVDQDFNNIKYIKKDVNIRDIEKRPTTIVIEIKNNELLTNIRDCRKKRCINRVKSVFTCVKMGLKYAKKYNKPPITGKFYFRTSDAPLTQDYPLFYYAKPSSFQGFLYPDFNFMQVFKEKQEKFRSIKKSNENRTDVNRTDDIFFKGCSSSENNSLIREKMKDFQSPFKIVIDSKRDPYWNISNYKYLLDLPGTSPWSVRLIELYLSSSFPFRVLYTDSNKEHWEQFYEKMFPVNESYKAVKCQIDNNKPISEGSLDHIKNKLTEYRDYLNENPKIYDFVTKRNFDKAHSMTAKHFGFYMYSTMIKYSQVIEKFH